MATLQTFGGGTTDLIFDPSKGGALSPNAPYTIIDATTMLPASGLQDASGAAVTQLVSDADARYAGSAMLEGVQFYIRTVGTSGKVYDWGPLVSTQAIADVVEMGPQLDGIAASAAASAFSAKQSQAAAELAAAGGAGATNASLLTSGTVDPARLPDLSGTYATASALAAKADASALAGKVAKGELVTNVKDKGAKGDGTTDDTAAVQAALDVGGRVYFPAGAYLCGALKVKSGSSLFTGGAVTILHTLTGGYTGNFSRAMITAENQPVYKSPTATDRTVPGVSASNITVDGITLDGNNTGVYSGLQFVACDNVNVSNVTIKRCGGALDLRAIRYSTFVNIVADAITGDGVSVTDQNFAVPAGVTTRGISTRLRFENCTVQNSQTDSSATTGHNAFEMDDGMSFVDFVGCKAINNRGGGFDVHVHTSEFDLSDVRFVDCVAINCYGNPTDTRQVGGFQVGQCPSGSYLGRITYRNCTSIGSPNAFSHASGAETGTATSITIDGGYWKSLQAPDSTRDVTRSSCIYVGKFFDDFKIRGATIAGAVDGYGVYTYSTSGSLHISDTNISECYGPLNLQATGGSVSIRGVRAVPGTPVSAASSVCAYILQDTLHMSDFTLIVDASKYTASIVRLVGVDYARVGAMIRNTGAVTTNAIQIDGCGNVVVMGSVIGNFTNGVFFSAASTSVVSVGNTFKTCTAKYNSVPAYLVDAGNAL